MYKVKVKKWRNIVHKRHYLRVEGFMLDYVRKHNPNNFSGNLVTNQYYQVVY